ncbi:GDSL-type esterase/lipase family protein [uncultured Psychrobacter sp.]|uniref:GDSL-type esterase/lipase family protein n=1 Tax=uncultured Psychrobacter sp. TaxID=259303 RepID=UPI0034598CD5
MILSINKGANKLSVQPVKLAVTLAAILAGVSVTACSDKPVAQHLPANSKVIALGDSLTYGYGASPNEAYPALLASMTGWRVLNAGVNGNTSADVLARTDTVVAQNPDLVLLGVGGNDVLRQISPVTTSANITATIGKFKAANIPVVLIAEPYFSSSILFGKASDNPIYKDIAKREKVSLYPKCWSEVISNDRLKSDQIHPNAAGYRYFAEGLYGYLQEEGWVR